MLFGLFKPRPEKRLARSLYEHVLSASRQPGLYGESGVPDTLEGRFEMVVLHTALVIRLLQASPDESHQEVSQNLFDAMFDDFDAAMREMGVGDSGVGKKIRFMAEGFYGRASAYEEALKGEGDLSLEQVLARNVFGSDEVNAASRTLADYVRRSVDQLAAQGVLALVESKKPDFSKIG